MLVLALVSKYQVYLSRIRFIKRVCPDLYIKLLAEINCMPRIDENHGSMQRCLILHDLCQVVTDM